MTNIVFGHSRQHTHVDRLVVACADESHSVSVYTQLCKHVAFFYSGFSLWIHVALFGLRVQSSCQYNQEGTILVGIFYQVQECKVTVHVGSFPGLPFWSLAAGKGLLQVIKNWSRGRPGNEARCNQEGQYCWAYFTKRRCVLSFDTLVCMQCSVSLHYYGAGCHTLEIVCICYCRDEMH